MQYIPSVIPLHGENVEPHDQIRERGLECSLAKVLVEAFVHIGPVPVAGMSKQNAKMNF